MPNIYNKNNILSKEKEELHLKIDYNPSLVSTFIEGFLKQKYLIHLIQNKN